MDVVSELLLSRSVDVADVFKRDKDAMVETEGRVGVPKQNTMHSTQQFPGSPTACSPT